MEKKYTIEQDGNTIKVRRNTDIEELISFCQYLLNVEKLKEINLIAIQNAIEILDKACIELMNQNPEFYRLNKLTESQTKKNKQNSLKKLEIRYDDFLRLKKRNDDEIYKRVIKENVYLILEVKLLLGKPQKPKSKEIEKCNAPSHSLEDLILLEAQTLADDPYEGYKETFSEEEKQKLDKIYEENKTINNLIIQKKIMIHIKIIKMN